jgi:hypothetical protein
MICTYSNPVNYLGATPADTKLPFQFKTLTCNDPTGATGIGTNYITITSPAGLSYEIAQSFTYGDLLNAGLMSMVLIVFLFWGVYLLTFRRKY